jgi:hypothetical protein
MQLAVAIAAVLSSYTFAPQRRAVLQPYVRVSPPRCCAPSAARDLSGDGGCLMEQLRAAPDGAAQPSSTSYVTVHFEAALSDGTMLHDSRAGDIPLEVRLGQQQTDVVPGWELALPQMRVGERVRLTCAPHYAFGEEGSPPLIPAGATVVFDLELLAVRELLSSNNTEEVDFLTR